MKVLTGQMYVCIKVRMQKDNKTGLRPVARLRQITGLPAPMLQDKTRQVWDLFRGLRKNWL